MKNTFFDFTSFTYLTRDGSPLTLIGIIAFILFIPFFIFIPDETEEEKNRIRSILSKLEEKPSEKESTKSIGVN